MDRTRTGLILVLVTLLMLSGLYFYLGSVEPEAMAPGDVGPASEGKYVSVQGALNEVRTGDSTTRFELVDPEDGKSVQVFCSFPLPEGLEDSMDPGTTVEVVGEVGSYKGEVEVVVDGLEDLHVLFPPEANEVGMRAIFNEKEAFEDMTVSVWGHVEEFDISWGDATFVLGTGPYKVHVRVSDHSPQVPFGNGSAVRVVGRLWTDDDGRVRLSASGWEAVTVDLD